MPALILAAATVCCSHDQKKAHAAAQAVRPVKPGVEVFLERYAGLVKGKRVGLITNPTGVDHALRTDVELFLGRPDFKLAALYGPEHGAHVGVQAGETVSFYIDGNYGVPVYSLYREAGKIASGMLKDRDAYMRSIDTSAEGKTLEQDMVQGIDVIIFDMQDVGTRVYTYVSTMAFAMETCAEKAIPFIVLDRPNPIGGKAMEGPVLDPAFASFIGVFSIPLRHGMTVGELAMLFNDRFLKKKVFLTVIPVEGWERGRWFDETGLPWVMPSPNMPTLDTAAVYPGQVMIEGTNVSEGRGTTRPFELFGAPWIDGYSLAAKLNSLGLPGIVFREAWFTPTFSKFKGERCGGCQIHVLDRAVYNSVETALNIIKSIRDAYPQKFQFHADYFDKVMGTSRVREAIESGRTIKDIAAAWEPDLRKFDELRKPYLLYK
jgi:uncharacterized protein YbbC (DUF1343 family)